MKKSLQPSLFTDPVKVDEDPFTPVTRDTKDYKLLSLDIATHTGWCTRTASGVWDFTPKRGESTGVRLIRFKGRLKEICEIEDIRLIAFESIPVYGKFPNIVGLEMVGVLKLFCHENNIQCTPYSPSEIKKFATGRGNAKKPDMLLAAKKYKQDVSDFDEADAVLIYKLVCKDLSL